LDNFEPVYSDDEETEEEADDSPLAIDEAVVELDVPQLDSVKQVTKSPTTKEELKQIYVGNLGETLAGLLLDVSAVDQEGKKARFGVLSECQVLPKTTDDTSERIKDEKVGISEDKMLSYLEGRLLSKLLLYKKQIGIEWESHSYGSFLLYQACYFDLCDARMKEKSASSITGIRQQIDSDISELFPHYMGACDSLHQLWLWRNTAENTLREMKTTEQGGHHATSPMPIISDVNSASGQKMMDTWLNRVFKSTPWTSSDEDSKTIMRTLKIGRKNESDVIDIVKRWWTKGFYELNYATRDCKEISPLHHLHQQMIFR